MPASDKLVPFGSRQLHQRLANITEIVSTSTEPIALSITYRRDNGPWTTASGTLAPGPNGTCIWRDVGGAVETWPPDDSSVQYAEFTRMTHEALQAFKSISDTAVDNIRHTANNATADVHQVAQQTAHGIDQSLSVLTQQQLQFNNAQTQHFINYDQARDEIENQRLELTKWEVTLKTKAEELAKKITEAEKANGEAKDLLKLEAEKLTTALAKQRKEMEDDRAEYDALLESTHQAKRKQAKEKIKALLQPQTYIHTPAPSSCSSFAPPLPSTPQVNGFGFTKGAFGSNFRRPTTNGFGGGGGGKLPPKSISFLDEDDYFEDSDEDADTDFHSTASFATVQSRKDFIVETNAWAFEPRQWKGRLNTTVINHTLKYLHDFAFMKEDHWSTYIIRDHIITLRGLMHTIISIPHLLDKPEFVTAITTILKRLYMFHSTKNNHTASYINSFSEAVDGADDPEWITTAKRHARAQQKLLVEKQGSGTTHTKKPSAKKSGNQKN